MKLISSVLASAMMMLIGMLSTIRFMFSRSVTVSLQNKTVKMKIPAAAASHAIVRRL